MAPVAMKAPRQPAMAVTPTTRGGAIMAPRLEPLLQTPMARVRASAGTHARGGFGESGPGSGFADGQHAAEETQTERAAGERGQHAGGGPPTH